MDLLNIVFIFINSLVNANLLVYFLYINLKKSKRHKNILVKNYYF